MAEKLKEEWAKFVEESKQFGEGIGDSDWLQNQSWKASKGGTSKWN